MSRHWFDRDGQARAIALADAVAARTGGCFRAADSYRSSEDAAFRAIRSLAVADVADALPVGKGRLRGTNGSADAAAERMAEAAAERADVEAQALADARIAYDAELGAALDHARQLIDSLGKARAIDADALTQGLRGLVLDLVEQVVGAHVAADPSFIAARVDEALGALKTHLEPGRLVLNPADLALVDTGTFPNLTLVGDPSLPRGGLRLEASGGETVDGPDIRMGQLRAGLGG